MADVKELSVSEIEKHLENHEDWFLTEEQDKIATAVEFEKFEDAAAFTIELANIADEIGHHPDVYIYDAKYMQILVSTHDVDGFSEKDVEFMEAFDEFFEQAADEADDSDE